MKYRVLVVDDDPPVREAISKVLQASGYEVVTAGDGEEARIRFVSGSIDAVVLDLNLPSQSGWDVFERLTARHPSVPVIIITGMPDQYPTALAAGVGALVEKPIEAPTLLKIMDELLAEPPQARLRRMCGLQHDTKYLRPPGPGPARHWRPPVTKARHQGRAFPAVSSARRITEG